MCLYCFVEVLYIYIYSRQANACMECSMSSYICSVNYMIFLARLPSYVYSLSLLFLLISFLLLLHPYARTLLKWSSMQGEVGQDLIGCHISLAKILYCACRTNRTRRRRIATCRTEGAVQNENAEPARFTRADVSKSSSRKWRAHRPCRPNGEQRVSYVSQFASCFWRAVWSSGSGYQLD